MQELPSQPPEKNIQSADHHAQRQGQFGNKLFAAILIAGIVAMAAGILAKEIVEPEKLKENAFPIAVTEDVGTTAGGAAAPAALEPVTPLLATASAENGAKVAKVCMACHSFDKGGANKVGPNLWGIFKNKHGHMEGYAYSKEMMAQTGMWDAETLNKFLANPKAAIPGTKMGFAGLKKANERADVIAYLHSLADSPQPMN